MDPVVCFANSSGRRMVLGVNDKASGPGAFLGTAADIAYAERAQPVDR